MSIDFKVATCQTVSNKNEFGLCDDPPPVRKPAYIDENDGRKWIEVVVNDDRYHYAVTFTAIDNCIDIRRDDGTMDKRCDGVLTYDSNVIFVELKARGALGSAWVKDAESQLRTTISYFEKTEYAEEFSQKRAYIANSEHPRFKVSQTSRMDKFCDDTGYVLRVENRIRL
jgi:hypothetical protein